MNIINENNEIVEMTSLHKKIESKYYWIFDFDMFDFTLSPIDIKHQIQNQTLTIDIEGTLIEAPAYWQILIYSEDTQQIDVAKLDDFTRMAYHPVIYDVDSGKLKTRKCKVVNYSPMADIVVPQLVKNKMLCHPIGIGNEVICLTPSDAYRKYLSDKVLADLIM